MQNATLPLCREANFFPQHSPGTAVWPNPGSSTLLFSRHVPSLQTITLFSYYLGFPRLVNRPWEFSKEGTERCPGLYMYTCTRASKRCDRQPGLPNMYRPSTSLTSWRRANRPSCAFLVVLSSEARRYRPGGLYRIYTLLPLLYLPPPNKKHTTLNLLGASYGPHLAAATGLGMPSSIPPMCSRSTLPPHKTN